MFHCNGWCFTWAVTAFGATHVCLRRVEPGRVWDLIDAEGITHFCGAPDRADRRSSTTPRRTALAAAGHRHGRRRAALARPCSRKMRALGLPPGPRLRADRDLRPAHRLRVAPGVGRACPTERAGPPARPARARRTSSPTSCAWSTSAMQRRPADGETLGEVVMRGNNVMTGYYRRARGDGRGVPRRLVPLRRPRGVAPRRLHRAARPQEGHHHLRRREHLDDRGRAGRRHAPGGAGVRGRRDPGREVGRAPEGVRDAQARRAGDRGRDHRLLPRRTSPTSSARPRSSSASCRRPRPARSRSSCCANKEWGGRDEADQLSAAGRPAALSFRRSR